MFIQVTAMKFYKQSVAACDILLYHYYLRIKIVTSRNCDKIQNDIAICNLIGTSLSFTPEKTAIPTQHDCEVI